jgi:hypothetical protein
MVQGEYADYSRAVNPTVLAADRDSFSLRHANSGSIAANSSLAYVTLYDFTPWVVGGAKFEIVTNARGIQRYYVDLLAGATVKMSFRGRYEFVDRDHSALGSVAALRSVNGYTVEIYNDNDVARDFWYALDIYYANEVV